MNLAPKYDVADTYGKWSVLMTPIRVHTGTKILCRCSCGLVKDVQFGSLKNKRTRSCNRCAKTEHGLRLTPEYIAWQNMIQRCTRKSHPKYPQYGGRGISVCDKWVKSFDSFLLDVGTKPSVDLQLDRINNDGNYEPSNVRWTTREININNRRNSKKA